MAHAWGYARIMLWGVTRIVARMIIDI